jgi:LysM repeat protein
MFGKFLIVLLLLTVTVAVVARTSSGHARNQVYIVRPADTLWSIATSHYGGDVREGIWMIEKRNHLTGPQIYPGQRLVLP